MSELSNFIFHGETHRLSSPFGKRSVITTSAGKTSSFHSGADYATFGKKLLQYAVADGTVISCGTDTAYKNTKYVWVEYPALGVRMLHYHLDSISVKKGQTVNKNTVIGATGKTGLATGIHLHLGIKRIGENGYIDPELWSEKEFAALLKKEYKKGSYKVTADVLNVRSGAGVSYTKKKFDDFTPDAQSKILKLSGRRTDGYVKGVTFTALEINGNWGRTPSGWVCLDYCAALN